MSSHNANYANYAEVKWSHVDFKLIFANQTVTAGGQSIDLHERTYISVSPQLAKQLAHVLAHTISQYESNIGVINVPLPPLGDGVNNE